jgi:hypothetical protein
MWKLQPVAKLRAAWFFMYPPLINAYAQCHGVSFTSRSRLLLDSHG